MGDLFRSYASGLAWDEMFEGGDATDLLAPRGHYVPLHDVLGTLSADDFRARCATRDRSFRDQGITFSHSGEERPFPLDLVPRVVPAEEWQVIEAGVAQRVRALEAFLADVYGPARYSPMACWLAASSCHRTSSTAKRPILCLPTVCASRWQGSTSFAMRTAVIASSKTTCVRRPVFRT